MMNIIVYFLYLIMPQTPDSTRIYCYRKRKIIKLVANLSRVEAGLAFRAEEYVYRSTIDYAGEKGVLNDVIVVQ